MWQKRDLLVVLHVLLAVQCSQLPAQPMADPVGMLQSQAIEQGRAAWGYWGTDPNAYYNWCNHSNRLVPVYTFGITLDSVRGANSVYRSPAALKQLYGRIPEETLNADAEYFDQTDVYKLQLAAVEAGKKYVILVIFDGLDFHTTRAAASYRSGRWGYTEGRGQGLRFQDYLGITTDFGYCVTAPRNEGTEYDVDDQTVAAADGSAGGGYAASLGGTSPWDVPRDPGYLLAWNELRYHPVTDSAAAATAMATGIKTFNGSININPEGEQLETIAHRLQRDGSFSIGIVTDVPISHATPAAMYAHNVSRLDSQDIARDLLGLPSIAHPLNPLRGVDVLLGAGWGEASEGDTNQGANYVPPEIYLTRQDRQRADVTHGGEYVFVERTPGHSGVALLQQATEQAVQREKRLLGVFGVKSGILPRPAANGDYQPATGVVPADVYTSADLVENPTLADLTRAALRVLSTNPKGFWLMVEAGDVDWGSHDANIDTVIGATLSGDEAFGVITNWVEQNDAWNDTAVIVTSDHGHGFVLTDPSVFAAAGAN